MHSSKTILAGLAAIGALALPGAASAANGPSLPDPIPVPAGQVQHTVVETSFTANYTAGGAVPWQRRTEVWIAANRAHTITRDSSGKIISESVVAGDRLQIYGAANNTIRTYTANRPWDPRWGSWQYQGALLKQEIDMGWYTVDGDTTALGRPAKVLHDTPNAPSDLPTESTIVADAATLVPLVRTTTGHDGDKTFTQTETVTTFETVDPASVDFSMSPHPGARAVAASTKARRHARHTKRHKHSPKRGKATSRR